MLPIKTRPLPKQNKENTARTIAKYSGIAFKMIIIISAFTFGGTFFDSYFATTKPWFTIASSLLGVGMGLYSALKDIK